MDAIERLINGSQCRHLMLWNSGKELHPVEVGGDRVSGLSKDDELLDSAGNVLGTFEMFVITDHPEFDTAAIITTPTRVDVLTSDGRVLRKAPDKSLCN